MNIKRNLGNRRFIGNVEKKKIGKRDDIQTETDKERKKDSDTSILRITIMQMSDYR